MAKNDAAFETKSWVEGHFAIVCKLGEFIQITNMGERRATFRGYQIDPQSVFYSTNPSVIGRMMDQDAGRGAVTTRSSNVLPKEVFVPDKTGPRGRYIKLNK
jgi:hypothetical protein